MQKSGEIKKLYQSLKRKYVGMEEGWLLWCKRPKTGKDREEVIISAVLTQNTNWGNVKLAIINLKREKIIRFKNILNSPRKKIESLIRPAGFYKAKADCLLRISEFIVKDYGGIKKIMKEDGAPLREKLIAIKGIGPETADSILLYAMDKPFFVIDEYTKRLVAEKKMRRPASYAVLQNMFERNLPKDYTLYQDFHALIVINGKNNK